MKRFFTGALFLFTAISSQSAPIFTIGTPDASAAEFNDFGVNFKKARFNIQYGENPYETSHAYFGARKIFNVDTDKASEFPFVMPIFNCKWADPNFKEKNPDDYYYVWELFYDGGQKVKFHPLEIKFSLKGKPTKSLWLKIGFADHSPVQIPSSVKIGINGKDLETFKVNYIAEKQNPYPSFATILYNSKTWGIPVSHAIEIPADKLDDGENIISILGVSKQKSPRATSEWLAFDYIQLDEDKTLPTVENPLTKESELVKKNLNFDKIVFATRGDSLDGHWYGNFGRYPEAETGDKKIDSMFAHCIYPTNGGKLAVYDIKSGKVETLIDDPTGGVRNPTVHYDAQKMLFAYRKGGEEHYKLYETDINGKNISPLKINEEGYDDFEGCYLPNDDIVFLSSRCKRCVPCWAVDVATLHRYFRDENVVRSISTNVDQDNSPAPTSDGRLIYMKWEYVQKNQLNFHALWKKDQNGANDMIFFGNDIAKNLLIDARQIGESSNYVCTFAPDHGRRDHTGAIARIESPKNPADADAFKFVSGENMHHFSTPIPLDDNLIMASDGSRIVIMDKVGHIFSDIFPLPADYLLGSDKKPLKLREPSPIRPQKRGLTMPDMADYDSPEATVVLVDAAIGRNMEGVKNGDIKELLVVEILPNAVHLTGGMEPYTLGGTFSIERPLGKVKVEADGSAHFKVPANRAIAFVALDKDGKAVKRMQSFTNFISGTTTSCIGCHENRDMAPPPIKNKLAALRRPADSIKPIAGVGTEVIDFVRDIQPILDKYCVSCHNPTDYKGKLDLSDGVSGMYAKSYFNLRVRRQLNDGFNRNGNQKPYTFGSGGSLLMKKIDGSHKKVSLSKEDFEKMKVWLDMGSIHAASCAAADSGTLGSYYNNNLLQRDKDWKERSDYCAVIEKNCASCHKKEKFLPSFISGDKRDRTPWHWLFYLDKNNPRNRLSHHAVFNITHPKNSAILMAPLAKASGGRAKKGAHPAIFQTTDDENYKTILAYIEKAKAYVESQNPRYTSSEYTPRGAYLNAMKRFGIIKDGENLKKFNAFECDKKYWDTIINPKPWKYEK